MNDEDLQIENILENNIKKKTKVDGKSKGNRTELNLCKILTNHFNEEFSRAPGSGARTSQVGFLPEHAKKTLTGDLTVPENFLWVIECKGGYEKEMNLTNICEGIPCLDNFISQVTKDSAYCERKPIIFWKRNRKPWLAIVKKDDMPLSLSQIDTFTVYKSWVILHLDTLLDITEREFWYE